VSLDPWYQGFCEHKLEKFSFKKNSYIYIKSHTYISSKTSISGLSTLEESYTSPEKHIARQNFICFFVFLDLLTQLNSEQCAFYDQ
jgi:hypothetical protein